MTNKLSCILGTIVVILLLLLVSSIDAGEKQFERGKLTGLQLADKGYIGGYNDALNNSYNQSVEIYNTGIRNGWKQGFNEGINGLSPVWSKPCTKEELNAAHNRGFDYGYKSGLGQPEFEKDLFRNNTEYIVLRTISYAEIARITGRNSTSSDAFQIIMPHIKGINGTYDEPSAGYGMPEFLWVINNTDNKTTNDQTGN